MSLSNIITGANLPIGNVNSIFKNPAAEGIANLSSAKNGLAFLGTGLADETFDPTAVTGQISSCTGSITTALTTKVSALGTELPLVTAAAQYQTLTESVDSILAGDSSSIPPPIDAAFATTKDVNANCPNAHITAAMAPITQSNSLINTFYDSISAKFNNTGAMSSLYTSLNAIPGVLVSDGKQLLAFLGNIPAGLTTLVTSAVSSTLSANPTLGTSIKSAFADVSTSVSSLSSSFSTMVSDAAASVTNSIAYVKGITTVNLINSKNPCTAQVMSKVVDETKIDNRALTLAQDINEKNVSLPGSEAINAVNLTAPLTVESIAKQPGIPATQITSPVVGPTIVPYTSAELSAFKDLTVVENDKLLAWKKESAEWYKTNIEEWKITVQYESKKQAAAPTEAKPYGTSTDLNALAAWKAVYDGTPSPDNYVYKRDYFNANFLQKAIELDAKYRNIFSEYKQRSSFGKFPYTYVGSQGQFTPEENRYTFLDSTK